MNIDKIYIINLDRNKDRYKTCVNMLNKLGGIFNNFVRLPAVDGKKLEKNQIYDLLTVSALHSLYNYYHLDSDIRSVGAIGCYLSHHKIWEDMIKNDYKNVIVFEDDTSNVKNYEKIIEFLNNLPVDYDIAFLNYYNYNISRKDGNELTNINNHWCVSLDNTYFFTDSYVISKKGAEKLIEKAFPISEQVDAYIHNIATLNSNFKRYFSKKKLFKQNGEFESNIQDDCFKCRINRYMDFLSDVDFIELIQKMKIKEDFTSDLDNQINNFYSPVHNFDRETNFINNEIIENFINQKKNNNNELLFTLKFIVIIFLLFLILNFR